MVWFTFSVILTYSSFSLFSRLCIIKQKHSRASKKSHKPLVPLKLLLQSWTQCTWSILFAFRNKPNRPVSDGRQNVTYRPYLKYAVRIDRQIYLAVLSALRQMHSSRQRTPGHRKKQRLSRLVPHRRVSGGSYLLIWS